VPFYLLSQDHCLIFAEVNYNISLRTTCKSLIWDYSNADVEGLEDVFFPLPWDLMIFNSPGANNAFPDITDVINQNANDFIPTNQTCTSKTKS